MSSEKVNVFDEKYSEEFKWHSETLFDDNWCYEKSSSNRVMIEADFHECMMRMAKIAFSAGRLQGLKEMDEAYTKFESGTAGIEEMAALWKEFRSEYRQE